VGAPIYSEKGERKRNKEREEQKIIKTPFLLTS
jgi:hypothetical protein